MNQVENGPKIPGEKSVIRGLLLVSTVTLAWAILTLGAASGEVDLRVGELATRDYVAQRSSEVEDQEATEARREAAAGLVETLTIRDESVEQQVNDDLSQLFAVIRQGVFDPEPEWVGTVSLPPTSTTTSTAPTATTVSTTTSTTTTTTAAEPVPDDSENAAGPSDTDSPSSIGGEEEDPSPTAPSPTTVTVPPPARVTITGRVFLDFDSDGAITGSGAYPELGLQLITVRAVSANGEGYDTQTQANGDFRLEVPEGVWEVVVDSQDSDLPPGFMVERPRRGQTVACYGTESECATSPIPFVPLTRDSQVQNQEIVRFYPQLNPASVATLVQVAGDDVIREVSDIAPGLVEIERAALELMVDSFAEEIKSEDLLSAQSSILSDPPVVFIDGVRNPAAGETAADIAASFLRPNSLFDTRATEELRQEAREAQEPVTVTYRSGQPIIAEGQPLTRLTIDVIAQTGAATGRPVQEAGVLVVLAAVVAVLALFIYRIRPDLWDRIPLLSLFGMLTVLAAGAVRGATFVGDVFGYEVGVYLLPAVAFGYFAVVLLDNRVGLLMAVVLAVITAVGTRDPGATTYALLATLAPVGFVSAASSRRAFRNSVAISAVSLAVIAAATAWIFHSSISQSPVGVMLQAGVLAFASSLIGALVALSSISFFEGLFDVTTTLRLLDLTDRNHEALQLLQEKAFGTFNHSLMVGTLASAAAKAIGANNLLARAAAYYHDLGKTENPRFFIENQFGVVNPHDQMSPKESAAVIRQHVVDGMNLASRYRIPSSVKEGILTHHGTGIMRYFYDKALGLYGEEEVDVGDYRHVGEKPRSKEMAIVMLADGVEGACRAAFQATHGTNSPPEPTLGAIGAVIDGIIREKMSDYQLNEASLTFAELQSIRNAFVDAMSGHYHQRIQYPNFP